MTYETKVEVCDLDLIAVTGASQTLTQLGIIVNPRTKAIAVQNIGNANIYVNNNAVANANSFTLLPLGAVTLRVGLGAGLNLQFFCATTSDMNVEQMGD